MNITIDSRLVAFEGRPTILEVARANGIYIPSLCDHPQLEPYAACRLCLVEVTGRRGLVPACHTTAEEGLEVRTATPEIQVLRRGILELILAEHPNACLICAEKLSCDDYKSTIRKTGEVTGCVLCPVNGKCELQRVVEAVGIERVHYPSLRREGEIRRDDPFIDRDNSLCILCGRCVRVCHEVRGASVLTFVSRGSGTVVGTAGQKRLLDTGCRFCGACVDVCPTGSLADRGLRYERLPETEKQVLCPFCGQGCRLRVGLREGRVISSVPEPEGEVNYGQACVKGRFLVKSSVYHAKRLARPMVRKDGRLHEVSWEEALAAAAGRLAEIGAGRTAVAFSAQSSCEDLFVLAKFASEILKTSRATAPWVGSAAAELRTIGRTAGRFAPLNFLISEVGQAGLIVQFGEDLPVTQPILGLAVTKAARNGASVVSIPLGGSPANRQASLKVPLTSGRVPKFLEALTAAVKGGGRAQGRDKKPESQRPKPGSSKEMAREIARLLETRQPALFLFGRDFLEAAGGRSGLKGLLDLAAMTEGRVIPLDREANLRGGFEIAGAIGPRAAGAEALAAAAARGEIRALYLAGPFPALKPGAAELVIVQGSYMDENAEVADIILPEATSFEAEGTFVNIEGRIQLAGCAVEPVGEARPGWLILSSLAGKMGGTGFGYTSAGEVRKDLAGTAAAFRKLVMLPSPPEALFLIEEQVRPRVGIGEKEGTGRGAKPRPAGPGGPDIYKGLNLARENKSLRLVRGR